MFYTAHMILRHNSTIIGKDALIRSQKSPAEILWCSSYNSVPYWTTTNCEIIQLSYTMPKKISLGYNGGALVKLRSIVKVGPDSE